MTMALLTTTGVFKRGLVLAAKEGCYFRARPSRTFGTTVPAFVSRKVSLAKRSDKTLSAVYSITQQPFQRHRRRSLSRNSMLFSGSTDSNDDGFFADSGVTFESMGVQSQVLLERLEKLGLTQPTQIQAKAFDKILGKDDDATEGSRLWSNDVTIGAETGSGKTLAYLLPLLDTILQEKAESAASGNGGLPSYDYARVIVLVPNKELVQQVLRMAVPLCGGSIEETVVWAQGGGGLMDQLAPLADSQTAGDTDPSKIVRLAVMPGGLKEPMDFKPFRDSIGFGGSDPPVDIVVSTPAALGPLGLPPKFIDLFADVQTLVVDEADMLLDGGYIRALENVLIGFRRADKLVDPNASPDEQTIQKTQHVFCAATLPDVGLKSVNAYLERKFPYAKRIETGNMHNAKHYGLSQATKWYQVETKKERMERLAEMLLTEYDAGANNDGLKGEKTMVFLNSVDDVEGVHQALVQRGVNAVKYHAKMSLNERSENLDRFRRYSNVNGNGDGEDDDDDDDDYDGAVPALICTDLASRGLDVPGVTAVVQLQFSGNVVSHLHRMGRCGRAGQRTGRGIVFYDEQEAELVEVVQEAEAQQERMQLEGQEVDDRLNDDDDDGDSAEDKAARKGKVQKAFSRKRGFTKKRKKLRREETESY
eukprot:CAMPEP_0172384444 /NCGR_PEP_ID=MMETSP1061-20121228/2207_1 /TAXON_ID=37318 /ORGANISM="Pseudo-nitzschia pungens, Strain cf. pungens" /LENGTH=647 /DNA_ID=CAMNT_0013113069 /DNA_START=204 /DNA_END=2147 /DNA_ORIENTATION=+